MTFKIATHNYVDGELATLGIGLLDLQAEVAVLARINRELTDRLDKVIERFNAQQ